MLDILILAIIAIAIISKLFKILGRNDDNYFQHETDSLDPVVRKFYKDSVHEEKSPIHSDIEIVSAAEASLPQTVRDVLDKIRKTEPDFSADSFYLGVKAAFSIIVKAFVENDQETLANLLSDSVLKNFVQAIEERLAKNQELSKVVLGINSLEISSAALENGIATLIVQIVSDQITFVTDQAGNVIEGCSTSIVTSKDLWTFSRMIGGDKIWKLITTDTF